MSRMNRKVPLTTAQMYRHFAVITLVITAALAMFAQGEQDDAKASPTPAPPPYDAVDLAVRDPRVNRIAISPQVARQGEFGDDDDRAADEAPSFTGSGTATEADIQSMAARATAIPAPPVAAVSVTAGTEAPPPGMSKEEWEALQARKRRQALPEKADPQTVADMLAASRDRAGASDGLPD